MSQHQIDLPEYPISRIIRLSAWVLLWGIVLTGSIHAQEHSAPGVWSFKPSVLVSGQSTPLELVYVNSEHPIAAGASFSFLLEGISVKELQFTPISDELELVLQGENASHIEMEAGGVDGLGCRQIQLTFPEGLTAGENFALRIGNKNAQGEIMALVNPVPVQSLSFDIQYTSKSDGKAVSWLDSGWWDSLPKVDIVAAGAEALRIFAPTLIEVNAPFDLRVAVVDRFDSGAHPVFDGEVILESPSGIEGLPEILKFYPDNDNSRQISGLKILMPGIYRIRGRLQNSEIWFESNPIVARQHVEEPIYWGMLHGHSYYSECWGDGPRAYYKFGRDLSGLDYLALSDHYARLPRAEHVHSYAGRLYGSRFGQKITAYDAWLDTMDTADEYNQPGRFITLVGYEWSSEQSGHHNIYLADMRRDEIASIFTEDYVDLSYEMRNLLKKTEALFIPHGHAWYFPYSELEIGTTASRLPLSPVYEAYSDWGLSFHPPSIPDQGLLGKLNEDEAISYREAVSWGLELGLIADSDTHTGLPARRHPGGISPSHNRPQGITAVRMPHLDRANLISAYRQRKTYGTSGERIFLEVRSGQTQMGEILLTDEPVQIDVEVAGTDRIESVALYDGLHLIEKREMGALTETRLQFNLPAPGHEKTPYFVEVIQQNLHRAWSSPLWVQKKSLPDLQWELDSGGKLFLVNRGHAPAIQVSVLHADDAYPFVRLALEAKSVGTPTSGGLIWTRRWNDQKMTVLWRWKGEPLKGRVMIENYQDYRVDKSIRMLWFSTINDQGDGTIDFTGHEGRFDRSIRPGEPMHEGFDLTVRPSLDLPCSIHYEFEREVTVYLGDRMLTGQRFSIPINHLHTKSEQRIYTLDRLEAGERWEAPSSEGCWSADPRNVIQEKHEDNNLFIAGQ